MSRNSGESAEHWNARASAEYHAAWDELGVQWRRTSKATIAKGVYQTTHQRYDDAMDRLMVADCERGDAAIAMDRERRISDRDDR